MSYWNDTISLFKRNENENGIFWEKQVINNCFAKVENGYKYNNDVGKADNVLLVRIPKTDISVNQNDIVSLDNNIEIDETIKGKRSSELIGKNKVFKIVFVSENFKIEPKHILIKGI